MAFKLLVADNSAAIRKIVAMAFASEDATVEGIGDGAAAFARILQFNPDIVLAAADMSGMDGFELCAKIKASPQTSAVKVLLLANDFEEFDERRYRSCGADDHISKPFKSDDIVAMVKSLLRTFSRSRGEEFVAVVDAEEAEIFAEVRPLKFESLDELDSAFKKIVTGGGAVHHEEQARLAELLSLGKIAPPLEDFPERDVAGVFSEAGDHSEKLPSAILQTVREVVREVAPEIARRVIQGEIEEIKKRDAS